MSEPENFLMRWSRRKIEAEQESEQPAPTATGATAESAAPPEGKDEKPEFDIASLPSIDSISAATDVRAFLQSGVPSELTRAALRRVWTVDPTIRDFIGIAENQWDFATGDGIPGFGPLKAIDDVRKMVADIASEGFKRVEPTPVEPEQENAKATSEPLDSKEPECEREATNAEDIAAPGQDQPEQTNAVPALGQDVVQRNEIDIAMQQNSDEAEYQPLPIRRSHGGALPE